MRKTVTVLLSVMLSAAIVGCSAIGSAESQYVSIKEIRETIPQRWTGEYVVKNGAHKQLKKGDTVFIDVPIVVPEVDTVPVVRITWEPPVAGLDESFEINRNRWNSKTIGRNFPMDEMGFPVLEDNITFDPELPWEDAPAIAIEEFKKWFLFMKDKELTCYFQYSYGDSGKNGFQCLYFYTTYHGIPHLLGGDYFLHEVRSEYQPEVEGKKGLPGVPQSIVAMRIKRPGVFWANIDTAKEIGVDVEDIPLLAFDQILKVLEQQVTAGYAYSLNEVCFGYMGFIDPEKKHEEFILLPVWAAKGRTRGDLTLPFDLKNDQDVMDRSAYGCDSIVINAQTGETYDLTGDRRADRRYVPDILTWDEVN
ncbi:MAG: hypothetical protein RSE58_13050 [Clostridia bacterium]